MAFKAETIKKIVSDLQNMYNDFVNGGDVLTISISKGNRKIGHVHNVSIAPILSCGNCGQCASFCYDVKACLQYKNVRLARTKNYYMAMNHRKEYFGQIRKYLKRNFQNKLFRWHVGGEIPDYNYFCEMVSIARDYPEWHFWSYTKMYIFVNKYIHENGPLPSNLVIMYSEWDGTPLVNPFKQPIFTCKLKDGNKNHDTAFFKTLYKCPGNCDICKNIQRGCLIGESVYADEH